MEKDGPFDLVLSDMAPKTTGNRIVDQAGSERLCRAAMSWAESLLKPKGVFLFKVFQGPDLEQLVSERKNAFQGGQTSSNPKAPGASAQKCLSSAWIFWADQFSNFLEEGHVSGHNKWSTIKHKKGAADAKRGKLFFTAH